MMPQYDILTENCMVIWKNITISLCSISFWKLVCIKYGTYLRGFSEGTSWSSVRLRRSFKASSLSSGSKLLPNNPAIIEWTIPCIMSGSRRSPATRQLARSWGEVRSVCRNSPYARHSCYSKWTSGNNNPKLI